MTIVGARPQFIKAEAVSRAVGAHNAEYQSSQINEIIVHTGQHYDKNMSSVFFDQLNIQKPAYNLDIAVTTHGAMTGRMLEEIEKVLLAERPDKVLVYGDTNSTLAGVLAASKLHIPVAHVEAGLRSFNMRMPEEINRIVADRLSTLLLCPTETAVSNLAAEGISRCVHNVGDVMYDLSLYYRDKAMKKVSLSHWDVEDKQYALCTVHREENTDDPERLGNIFRALQYISNFFKIVLPLHPRTRRKISEFGMFHILDGLNVINPLSYLEIVRLEMSAKTILTDSGGVQKEAFFYKVPCLTLRDESEWVETIELGWNKLCGADYQVIIEQWKGLESWTGDETAEPYGKGNAADKILKLLRE